MNTQIMILKNLASKTYKFVTFDNENISEKEVEYIFTKNMNKKVETVEFIGSMKLAEEKYPSIKSHKKTPIEYLISTTSLYELLYREEDIKNHLSTKAVSHLLELWDKECKNIKDTEENKSIINHIKYEMKCIRDFFVLE